MRKHVIGIVAVLTVALALTSQAQTSQARTQLETARKIEMVDGDLNSAIARYKQIADRYARTDRAAAAEALLRMAECYQKLGDAEATAVYQRVISEFSDQTTSVMAARSSLARLLRPAATAELPVNRMVWRAPSSFYWFSGDFSVDGRFGAYIDWEGNRYDINILDVSTGRSRRLIRGGSNADGTWTAAAATAFSPDRRQLAYSWSILTPSAAEEELRVINVTEPETQKARTLVADPAFTRIRPGVWSPNGESIAVDLYRRDGTRLLGLVASRTGTIRVLKTLEPQLLLGGVTQTSGLHFSPDGQFLLFDIPGSGRADRDISAIRLADGKEFSVVSFPGDDALLGWTPDGAAIVFRSSRAGAPGIWIAPFHNGAAGRPTLVKAVVEIDDGFGITSAGTLLYVPRETQTNELKIASFDTSAGRFTGKPTDLATENVGSNGAARISPDGKSVAFISARPEGPFFVVKTLATGETRAFRLPLRAFRNANRTLWEWSFDGTGFYAIGTNANNQLGIHRIDVVSGEVTWTIPTDVGAGVRLPYDIDGKRLHYWLEKEGSRPDFSLHEWDIAAGRTRELYRTSDACRGHRSEKSIYCVKGTSIVRRDIKTGADTVLGPYEPGRVWQISPDERFLLTHQSVTGSTRRRAWLTDVVTGQSRELLPDVELQNLGVLWWAPDGNGLIVTRTTAQRSQSEAWWVPVDRAAPHRLSDLDGVQFDVWAQRGRSVGGQFVFETAGLAIPSELWALENFLPPAVRKN